MRCGAQGLHEELIDAAHALDGLVDAEERVDIGNKGAHGELAILDAVAGIKQKQRKNDSAEQIHQRAIGGPGANPAHVFSQQAAGGGTELRDFEVLHSKGLHHAVAGDGLLENLAEVGEAGLAFLDRVADLAAEPADRDDHQRQKHDGDEREFPVDQQQNGGKTGEGKDLPEEVGQPFGECTAEALDVVDHGGHQAAGGVFLKESDGLLDQLFVDLVAEVGDGAQTDALDDDSAKKLRESFDEEEHDQGNGEDGPGVVNARREKIIEIDHALKEGNLHQGELRIVHAGLQDVVEDRDDHQGGEALGNADKGHQHDAQREPAPVRPDVPEQPAQFSGEREFQPLVSGGARITPVQIRARPRARQAAPVHIRAPLSRGRGKQRPYNSANEVKPR